MRMTAVEKESEGLEERRIALIHRVIVPHKESPIEYSIPVTNQRSIFIRLEKTRSDFVLRREMSYGTALITDVTPIKLEDFDSTSLETLTTDIDNISVPHGSIVSLGIKKEVPRPRWYDFVVRLTMKMQKQVFQVYNFEMVYRNNMGQESVIKFYMVPLGAYFKPRRQTQSRETILREYTADAIAIFQTVIPDKIVSPSFDLTPSTRLGQKAIIMSD